ncbi:unnamed protein product [Ilex paraguariensis]|uniref:C3H1-type domain-containing protein n=1 Tax=Ilex paraguariensis TaxID=185542 RepID=A0ABC8TCX7_9AQUA
MSVASSYNPQFLTAPMQFDAYSLEHCPQFQVSDQQCENISYSEHQSSKRPGFSRPILDSRMPLKRAKMTCTVETEMCLLYRRGNCTYGDKCHFAHGVEEIRRLPYKMTDIDILTNEDHRIISKMKLCRKFCNGKECPYGDRCHFLHVGLQKVKGDLGLSRKSVELNLVTTGSAGDCKNGYEQWECQMFGNSTNRDKQQDQKPIYWKTRLCNKWERTGNCPYGVKCYFAHGQAELHKIGSHLALESGNVCPSKALATLANDGSVTKTRMESEKRQVQGKKCLFKRKEVEKINGIYADWVDALPLVHCSSAKVGI